MREGLTYLPFLLGVGVGAVVAESTTGFGVT